MVLYVPRREAELAQFEKRIQRERQKLDKQAKKLQKQVFNCAEDTQKALKHFNQQYKYHQIIGEISSSERYAQVGRPTETSEKITDWQVQLTIEPDRVATAQHKKPLGKYIIATNVLDGQTLSAEEPLSLY